MNEIDEIIVTGGRPLHGSVRIQGSKNAALPVMAAALLSTGTSVLRGCPRISDVYLMEKILKYLGAETWWEGQDLYLDCSHADGTMIPECYSGKMRSSVILMGAMLGRSKKAQTVYPGGCVIGKRPVDLHLYVLRCFGAEIKEEAKKIESADDLKDAKIGVQTGTTGDIYCSDDFGDDHVERFNKGADAVQALVTGKIDCVVIDNEPAKAFVKANKGLKLLKTAYAEEDYAIAVSKDKPELRKKINKALKELIDDGSVQKIINKYIKAE